MESVFKRMRAGVWQLAAVKDPGWYASIEAVPRTSAAQTNADRLWVFMSLLDRALTQAEWSTMSEEC